MRIPKKYGYSKRQQCPFCQQEGVTTNKQGVPVCQKHKQELLEDLHCVCGEWLDVMTGKWGPYFKCIQCGNINFKKGLEMNPQIKKTEKKKEITISSEDIGITY